MSIYSNITDNMKKLSIILISLIMSAATAFPVVAAGWVNIPEIGWFYDMESSGPSSSRYAKNVWLWIPDTSNQRVMHCYYFGPDGRMYASQTTPDGYQVNEKGEWIVNGVSQWKLNENYKDTPVPAPAPEVRVIDTMKQRPDPARREKYYNYVYNLYGIDRNDNPPPRK